MKILQELFAEAILSEQEKDNFEKEIASTQKTEEELILEKKLITEDKLFEIKSKILNLPFRKVKPEDVLQEVLEIMPEEAEINYKMVPLSRKDKVVEVGMPYPENIPAQNALRFLARQENFEYKVFLITITNFKNILNQRRTLKEETRKAIEEIEIGKMEKKKDTLEEKLAPKTLAEEAPIIKMVLVILRHAIENKASDIHIEPSREKLNIRFRLNGILFPSLFLPLKVHPAIVARIKILSGLKIDENRLPQDGRFSVKIGNKDVDFRVATFPTLYGEKVELRVLDSSTGLRTQKELNFWMKRDPIKLFENKLISRKVLTKDEILLIKLKIDKLISESFDFAKKSPLPLKSDLLTNVYAKN